MKRVILIDDDQVNSFVCESIIRSISFAKEVLVFEQAEEAHNYLSHVASTRPDEFPELIFLDINMPGMDGWQFIQEYKKYPVAAIERCNLFVLSSAVDRKDILSAKSHKEVKDFISKPLSPEILEFIREEFLRPN